MNSPTIPDVHRAPSVAEGSTTNPPDTSYSGSNRPTIPDDARATRRAGSATTTMPDAIRERRRSRPTIPDDAAAASPDGWSPTMRRRARRGRRRNHPIPAQEARHPIAQASVLPRSSKLGAPPIAGFLDAWWQRCSFEFALRLLLYYTTPSSIRLRAHIILVRDHLEVSQFSGATPLLRRNKLALRVPASTLQDSGRPTQALRNPAQCCCPQLSGKRLSRLRCKCRRYSLSLSAAVFGRRVPNVTADVVDDVQARRTSRRSIVRLSAAAVDLNAGSKPPRSARSTVIKRRSELLARSGRLGKARRYARGSAGALDQECRDHDHDRDQN
jgi:hypothetical protein